MINITRKEDCTGCNACGDVCSHRAIVYHEDHEGFYYPKVDPQKCTDCGLCEKACPLININGYKRDQLYNPRTIGAIHKSDSVRLSSTSGGLFSALADGMYHQNGYVGGAIFTDSFHVKHFISNNPDDINILRGSKHCQSDASGFYKQVKALLKDGEKVLVCGTPCQIAALLLFVGGAHENLVTVDFICLGINSPKVFHKHLSHLESIYGGKALSVQAKNKDTGWRSLAYKIIFSNSGIYHKAGKDDFFTQCFINTKCNIRPACFECKFKGFPRVSDVSLGDFWGIEKVDPSIDDNKGTSVVLLNTSKANDYFQSIESNLSWREFSIREALPGNLALLKSAIPSPVINRDNFYRDIEQLPFEKFMQKYTPKGGYSSKQALVKRVLSVLRENLSANPTVLWRILQINLIRKNSTVSFRSFSLLIPTAHTVLSIHKTAQIQMNGRLLLGYKRVRKSRVETALLLEQNSVLRVEGGFLEIYYGADIQVFKNATLIFKGNTSLNKNVQIICMDSISIGKNCLISRDVVIRDNDGGHQILTKGYQKSSPVTIGNNVWIGHGAMIMKGVTIGDGAIIGAGAWVTTNVKANAVVLGDPARVVQKDIMWLP